MKAWLLDDFIGLKALRLAGEVDKPAPLPGEVLIRIHYASLNPADRFLAERLYPAKPPLPHILGRDGAGIVEAVGQGVDGLLVGDRVVILRGAAGVEKPGTFAEFVSVPAETVVRAPASWNDREAAAAPLVYVTAHQALNQWGEREPGTVVITGVSGGVGLAATHLAKAAGHKVIGLSRSPDKYDVLKEQGCDEILDPSDSNLARLIKDRAVRGSVDLVVDNIAGELFDRVIDTLGYRGCVSVVGMLGGPVPKFNTAKLLFKRLRIGGVSVSDYGTEAARAAWDDIIVSLDKLGRRPMVDAVFPMPELKEAFARLAEGPLGKVLLHVSGD